jgi:4-hydroxythreonine-4-phosphate dehydrogenase
MGDPCGVGPEVCVKALAAAGLPRDAALTVVGSSGVLKRAVAATGVKLHLERVDCPVQRAGECAVLDVDNFSVGMSLAGKPTSAGGKASLEYIERAVHEIMLGHADALVTCPISKEAIAAAGSPYPGHTEMLGALAGGSKPVMLLVSGRLRVAFATTHLALRDVPRALTIENIAHTGKVFAAALKRCFGAPEPRVAVCALNPHAGDGGRFGDEEARLIKPAVDEIRSAGVDASGPYPSDTLFAKALAGEFDGVLALYHDQGMIPIKISGVGKVVNVTLGLPFVRTSVGHGTAYDIVGKGVADESSLLEAIRMAGDMVRASR